MPIVFIAVAFGVFFVYTNPTYSGPKGILELKKQQTSYDQALSNAKELQSVRDQLASKYNSLSPTDLDRLEKLMPDNVNNIRLLIDIKGIADKHNMQIQNVKFQATPVSSSAPPVPAETSKEVVNKNKDYGPFDLEFSTSGAYPNFVGFVTDLERSLRIVDIDTVGFTSDDKTDTYKYDLKVTTYWLKS